MWQQQQQQQQTQHYQPGMPVQGTPVGMQAELEAYGEPVAAPHDAKASQHGQDGDMLLSLVPPEVRSGFVRKVYSLLAIQLSVTFLIALYMNTQLTPSYVQKHVGILYLASFGTMALLLGVSCCCSNALRTVPYNYAFLALLTLGTSVMVGFSTVMYSTGSVLLALGTTAGVFLALTAYAFLTKTDFTGIGPYLVAGLFSLSIFGFMMMLFSWFAGASLMGSTIHKVYACGGVLLFVFYIIYDTQLIVGGQHKAHQHSVDDYVLATIDLYLDIINLFLFLLELMGDRR